MPDAKSVCIQCLRAWTNGDFAGARSVIADDITFVGPLGSAQGVDLYMSGLRRLRDLGVRSADVHKIFTEGDEVCLIYDLVSAVATIPCAAWCEVRIGMISSVHAFFDTRALG